MTFFPHEQPFTLSNTFCPSENVNPCRETPLSADFDYLTIRDFSVTIEWRLNGIVEYGPRLTPGKKTVPAAHSQWLHHRRAIWRWARTLDRRGEWWKEVEIEGLRRSIHTSLVISGLLCGDFRAFLFHTAIFVNGEYTLLTSWRLVRLPLIPQQPFSTLDHLEAVS